MIRVTSCSERPVSGISSSAGGPSRLGTLSRVLKNHPIPDVPIKLAVAMYLLECEDEPLAE
jgi:hypothetical protein